MDGLAMNISSLLFVGARLTKLWVGVKRQTLAAKLHRLPCEFTDLLRNKIDTAPHKLIVSPRDLSLHSWREKVVHSIKLKKPY
jgi:hypothetical protein